MSVLGLSQEVFKTAALGNVSQSETARKQIQGKIDSTLTPKFKEYYDQEEIKIISRFNSSDFRIMFQDSEDQVLEYSERSDGLRWIFNLFIDTFSMLHTNKPIILLIDEPGVHLHIDAQKKLLSLLKNFSKSFQVIFTTHSPFMLENDNLSNVIAIEKINDESEIKKITSNNVSNISHLETLSPVCQAIGFKFSNNIGFDSHKIQVVTEGVTDVMYLSKMSELLGYSSRLQFISSNGAEKQVHISNILWSWGIDFKNLFDGDSSGKRGKKLIDEHFGNVNTNTKRSYLITDILGDEFVFIEDLIGVWPIYANSAETSANSLPKIVKASDFIKHVSHKEVEIPEEIRKNFEAVFMELVKK